jgi:site-specific DNA recombinase
VKTWGLILMNWQTTYDQIATDNGGTLGTVNGRPAFCYIRVSTDQQSEEGKSGLPRQLENCHKVARANGYSIGKEHVFADDASGFEFDRRPELSRMRKLYRPGLTVVIEHLDRLSRNADWHQGFLLAEMRDAGVTPLFWKSFGSRVERAVLGAIAQDGMEVAQERMIEGVRRKAESGRVTARRPAYGYRFVDAGGNPNGRVAKETHYGIKEDEAVAVRLIFNMIAHECATVPQVIEKLHALGIKPIATNLDYWPKTRIRAIVRNPVYRGEFAASRWQAIVDDRGKKQTRIKPESEWIIVPVPAIVSPEVWALANENMTKNRRLSKRNAKRDYLLTGLITCASCGYRFGGSTQSGQTHYRCAMRSDTHFARTRGVDCPQSQIVGHRLESAVWRAVTGILLQPEILIAALEKDERRAAVLRQIEYLEGEIAGSDLEDQKLYRAYMADVFDENEYAARRKALKDQRERRLTEVTELKSKVLSPEQLATEKARIVAIAAVARARGLDDAPFDLKRTIIKMVVDKIVLDVDGGWFEIRGALTGAFEITSPNG